MKSIKTNPNSANGPDKGKIVNKLYCILLTTPEFLDYIFFEKNRHEVHHVRNCLFKKKHMAQTKSLMDSTRKPHKKEDSASCV
jgi:hypothetical protein